MNIVTLGNRCNTDAFLSKNKLRNYSGPFSYNLTDLETSLFYLNNRFDGFLDVIEVKNDDFKILHLPHWRMTKKFFVNRFIYENYIISFDNSNIYNLDRLLIWNHHDPIKDKNKLTNRYERILKMVDNEENILFLYFSKIISKEYIDAEVNKVIKITEKYNFNGKLCYVIFVESYGEYDVSYYKSINNLDFFLCDTTPEYKLVEESKIQLKSGTPLLDCDTSDKNIKWDKLSQLLKTKYKL